MTDLEKHAEAILRAAGAIGLDLCEERRAGILTALQAYGAQEFKAGQEDMRETAAKCVAQIDPCNYRFADEFQEDACDNIRAITPASLREPKP